MARIRSLKPGYRKKAIPAGTRHAIALRYGMTGPGTITAHCVYCGAEGSIWWVPGRKVPVIAFGKLELDHVIPEVEGGSNGPDDIVVACQRCNRSKGCKMPDDPRWCG